MTIRSPRITVRLISRSTWNWPYHLFMLTISIAVSKTMQLGIDRLERLPDPMGCFLSDGRCGSRRSRYCEYFDMPKQQMKNISATKDIGAPDQPVPFGVVARIGWSARSGRAGR